MRLTRLPLLPPFRCLWNYLATRRNIQRQITAELVNYTIKSKYPYSPLRINGFLTISLENKNDLNNCTCSTPLPLSVSPTSQTPLPLFCHNGGCMGTGSPGEI